MSKGREKKIKFMDAYRKVRKSMPPATKVINPKKTYDRSDKSWLYPEDDEDDGDDGQDFLK